MCVSVFLQVFGSTFLAQMSHIVGYLGPTTLSHAQKHTHTQLPEKKSKCITVLNAFIAAEMWCCGIESAFIIGLTEQMVMKVCVSLTLSVIWTCRLCVCACPCNWIHLSSHIRKWAVSFQPSLNREFNWVFN